MIRLRVLCFSSNTRTKHLLKKLLNQVAIVNCLNKQSELQQLLQLRAYDLLILDDDGLQQMRSFSDLRSQFQGLVVLLTSVEFLRDWSAHVRDSNTLLFVKPLHSEVLLQLCHQQLVAKEFGGAEQVNELIGDLHLSNLEHRCLHLLLNAAASKMHKSMLQRHLFGESSYLYDARLDACWSRLRKKLAKQAPHLNLRRDYGGFLEIAACAS